MRSFLKKQIGLKPRVMVAYYPTLKHGIIIDLFRNVLNPLPRPSGRGKGTQQNMRGFNPISA